MATQVHSNCWWRNAFAFELTDYVFRWCQQSMAGLGRTVRITQKLKLMKLKLTNFSCSLTSFCLTKGTADCNASSVTNAATDCHTLPRHTCTQASDLNGSQCHIGSMTCQDNSQKPDTNFPHNSRSYSSNV